MYISLILFLGAIILGIVLKKSKWITFLIYIIMVALAAFRTASADFTNYYNEYKSLYKIASDNYRYIGFTKLEYFFSGILEISFSNYLIIFYAICFLLLILCVKSMTDNVNFVLSFYLIYSYALDVVQMKTLIANVFSLCGMCILFNYLKHKDYSNKKNNYLCVILSLCCMIISVLLHFSALYFMVPWLFLLVYYNKNNITRKAFIITVIILIAIYSGLITGVLSYAGQFGIVSAVGYLNTWTEKKTSGGWIVYTLVVVIMIAICRFLRNSNRDNSILIKYVETSVFIVPFLILNVVYFRTLRLGFVVLYSYIANIETKKNMFLKEFIAYILFFVMELFVFFLEIYGNYDNTLGALINNNSILSF